MKKIISPITGKSKYLLIENCEFISEVKISNDLKESLKLSAGKAGTLIVKNLPGTILNRENQNGRIYSTDVLAEAIREAKPLLETKQLLSSAHEHPEGSFVAPTDASHVVTNAYIKRNVRVTVDGEEGNFDMLFLDIEVLNTDEGKNLRALLEAGCSVGTSIRGVGDMEGKYVRNYEFLGVDFVGNPSSSTYTRMPVSESAILDVKDPRLLAEKFTVTTSSTNVTRDLEQAAMLQQQLEAIGYGTVTKTSTKLDQETDPKTGAQTSITTLEAETSDDVSDLDQALQMAKNAMLNGTVNVDSITIENIPEEGQTESAEVCNYVPEKATLKEEPVTEAKKEDETDPNLGKKFVLHTDRGFVTFDKNAIDFTDKPEDALHFTEGKEENGMVSMSKVTEILDAMGIFDVEKYFQKSNINLGSTETSEKMEPEASTEEATMTEENGANTKYVAQVSINSENGSNSETIPVSAVDLESAKNEISNLWDMKNKSIEGNGSVEILLTDTTTGEQLHYNPQTQLFEGSMTEANDGVEIKNNKVISTLDDGTTIEKEFDSPLEAKVSVAAVNNDEADPNILVSEEADNKVENPITCAWCKDTCEASDCKFESDLGVLCDRCQRDLAARGVDLTLSDEVICDVCEEQFDLDQVYVNGTEVICKTCEAKRSGDYPSFGENSVEEKLYSKPSEPSDGYEKETLEDSVDDFLVTLSNIDWDIDAIVNSVDLEPGETYKEIFDALPDPWTIRLNGMDLDTCDGIYEIRKLILATANKQAPWAIKSAYVDKIENANTGEVYYSNTEEEQKPERDWSDDEKLDDTLAMYHNAGIDG